MQTPILYTYSAKLIRIIDADSLILNLDRGFGDSSIKTIRLARINAPEIRGKEKEAGLIAKKYLEDLLGKDPVLTIQSLKLDSWKRSIAEVWYQFEGNWVNLNNHLLEAKIATKYDDSR